MSKQFHNNTAHTASPRMVPKQFLNFESKTQRDQKSGTAVMGPRNAFRFFILAQKQDFGQKKRTKNEFYFRQILKTNEKRKNEKRKKKRKTNFFSFCPSLII